MTSKKKFQHKYMVMRLNREISEEFEHIKPKINLPTTEVL